jgi:hypothetical protein
MEINTRCNGAFRHWMKSLRSSAATRAAIGMKTASDLLTAAPRQIFGLAMDHLRSTMREAGGLGIMMKKLGVLLAVAALLGTSLSAQAQGTYSNGIRSGYAGSVPNSTGSPSSTNTSSSGASSYPAPATRNLGTGRDRSEGAMGLTPQLQKELGISRQQ